MPSAWRSSATREPARRVVAADVDDRALEDRVYREAIEHGLDLAIVERAAIAREEILDRCTIFEVAFARLLNSPGSSSTIPFQNSHPPRNAKKIREIELRDLAAVTRIDAHASRAGCNGGTPTAWVDLDRALTTPRVSTSCPIGPTITVGHILSSRTPSTHIAAAHTVSIYSDCRLSPARAS